MAKEKNIKLQGHEKFALRDGWLNKGLIAVSEDPTTFQGQSGPDKLGIGNNMVKSLRYWMKAFGLLKENGAAGVSLTEVAEIIEQYDLYFEDLFTLWVLHYKIATNKKESTSWYMYFNRCNAEELTKEQIEKILYREILKEANGETFSEKSLKSDIDVLLNMYSKNKEMVDPEDKNISPLSVLGLVKYAEGKYVKTHPDRRIINEWNVLYVLSILMKETEQLSIEKLINDEGGLVDIYQMTSVMANEMLDRLDTMGYIRVDRTAGLDMIYKKKEITEVEVMEEYYNKHKH
ncbi:DUF4007 family protein [Pseudobutyrivibrio sp.]|uniref:DUF4007 family protein n=1 Tax=Pseudobutyrivibrio sp. TaxID=2014367 RepID=UPI003863F958